MSVRALGAAWRIDCEPMQKLLLLALADHANDETFDCWPSLTHLCKKTGLVRSTITRALNALESAQLISREQREKQSTRYVLNVSEWVHSEPRFTEHLGAQTDGVGAQRYQPRCTPHLELGAQKDHKHQSNHQGTINEPSINKEKAKRTPVPIKEILSLYHEHLPMCPAVQKLTEARRQQIEARWRQGDIPDLDSWRDYFAFVAKSKFLTGRAPPQTGHKPFLADIDFLIRESSAVKIFEGKYT